MQIFVLNNCFSFELSFLFQYFILVFLYYNYNQYPPPPPPKKEDTALKQNKHTKNNYRPYNLEQKNIPELTVKE